jgi:hypothetical protein
MGFNGIRLPVFTSGFPKPFVAGIVALVGLIFMFCPSVELAAFGFWLFISGSVVMAMGGLYRAASLILGGENDKTRNGAAFIAMAFVLAALVASPTIKDALSFASDASRALIETPAIVAKTGNETGGADSSEKAGDAKEAGGADTNKTAGDARETGAADSGEKAGDGEEAGAADSGEKAGNAEEASAADTNKTAGDARETGAADSGEKAGDAEETGDPVVTGIIRCWRNSRMCPSFDEPTPKRAGGASGASGTGAPIANPPPPAAPVKPTSQPANGPVGPVAGAPTASTAPKSEITAADRDNKIAASVSARLESALNGQVDKAKLEIQRASKEALENAPQEGKRREDALRTRTTSWIAFFTVAVAMLLLARVMRRARIRYESQGDASPDAPALPRVIISYPAWVALCVYAAILLPAAYFSVGSLLYLNLDAPDASLASVSESLVETRTKEWARIPDAPPPTEELSYLILDRLPGNSTEKARAQHAVEVGRSSVAAIESGRDSYEKAALENAASLKMTATGTQFEDYRLVLIANYSRVINKARQDAQPCLRSLADLTEALRATPSPVAQESPSPDATQKGEGARLSDAGTRATNEPGPTSESNAPNQSLSRAIDKAHRSCIPTEPFPAPPGIIDITDQQSFPGVLYGWLAQSSNATVLIVGLIGFGLFGAAIRTMGKPNDNLVEAPEAGDPTAGPQEFALTSNTAKILVQGLGAAFTVFLSQAATLLFTTGGKPNPYGLLLACFVGAVFAEEIWRQMEKLVANRFKEPSGDDDGAPNGAAPRRTPPATPITDVQEPAAEAEAGVPSTATETEVEVDPAPQDAETSADAETVEDAHEERTETGTGEQGPDGGQPSGEEADPDEPADTAEALTIPSRPEGT